MQKSHDLFLDERIYLEISQDICIMYFIKSTMLINGASNIVIAVLNTFVWSNIHNFVPYNNLYIYIFVNIAIIHVKNPTRIIIVITSFHLIYVSRL